VLVWTRNWVCAFLEHFLLPRCTCLFLVGMAGDQRSAFLQSCCILHILISIRNHNYNEKLRRVLVSTWNWLCAALEHFPWPRCTCLFLVVWQVIRGVHSFSAAAFLNILLSITNLHYWKVSKIVLEELGTEYVQLWSTFPYQGAHTPKQEGRGCVKRCWNSPKASALLHILLSIPNRNYSED